MLINYFYLQTERLCTEEPREDEEETEETIVALFMRGITMETETNRNIADIHSR